MGKFFARQSPLIAPQLEPLLSW